jgi:hypothetical protein
MSTEIQVRDVSQPSYFGGGDLLSRLDPTHEWGSQAEVTLYLDRCQVDTPDPLVQRVWNEVLLRRKSFAKVVDFGAGDGRFARYGHYTSYTGVEIDGQRCLAAVLPNNAKLIHSCAFSLTINDADLCIGKAGTPKQSSKSWAMHEVSRTSDGTISGIEGHSTHRPAILWRS